MPFLQEVIHKLEVGGGMRFMRIGAALFALALLTVGYNLRAFKCMATQEAMDAAQLGRNLAQGKGYTTLFIRPFSIHLMKERTQNNLGRMSKERVADPPQLKGMHPDISNPPVYPVALAGIMKVLPFHYTVDLVHPFWRHQPDFLIGLFNQCLFFLIIVLTFLLARRLFDPGVAWLSGTLLLFTELFWRFSVSGLSTMLVILVFIGLVWCLVLLEQ